MDKHTELRVETLKTVKRCNPRFGALDKLCYESKNIYNEALYILINDYAKTHRFMGYNTLYRLFYDEHSELYHRLPTQTSQQTLMSACEAFKNYLLALKDYKQNPSKYKSEPKPPHYKPRAKGRYTAKFTNQQVKYKDKYIYFPEAVGIEPMRTRLDLSKQDNSIGDLYKPPDYNPISEVRIIPTSDYYVVELVYEKEFEIKETPTKHTDVLAIDLGINNYATMIHVSTRSSTPIHPIIITGRGIKSYNKDFNYKLGNLKSQAMKFNHKRSTKATKATRALYSKRGRVLQNFYHNSSRFIINYCKENQISQIIIGYNEGWKQASRLSKRVNETFIQIGFLEFIEQLEYKGAEEGITVIRIEERYTSGTSFLDNELPIKENYNNSRRLKRGIFQSNSGLKINADVNAAYQIFKKVYPNCRCNTEMSPISLDPIKYVPVKFKKRAQPKQAA